LKDETAKRNRFSEDRGQSLFFRHISGDNQAFSELMRLFQSQVYSYLVRAGVPVSDRDDLFQEIVLKIHRAREQYDQTKALFPWIFTIAVNTVRSHFKQKRQVIVTDSNPEAAVAEAADSRDQFEARETSSWLENEIGKLSLAEREVIILCCVENIDQTDAAELLGLSINTLKTHLRRGRMKLAAAHARRNTLINREVMQ